MVLSTVVVGTGAGGRAVPGCPGSLPVGVGGEGRGGIIDGPGARAMGDENGEECSECDHLGREGGHRVSGYQLARTLQSLRRLSTSAEQTEALFR